MRQNRIIALLLALFMLFAPLSDTLQTVAALAEVSEGAGGSGDTETNVGNSTAASSTSLSPKPSETAEPDATSTSTVEPDETSTSSVEPDATPTSTVEPDTNSTETPEPTKTPGSSPVPVEDGASFVRTVPMGFAFRMARGAEGTQTQKSYLTVSLEWVDDGASHMNKLVLQKQVNGEWKTVDLSEDTVTVNPDPKEQFTGARTYTYTVDAGVNYKLTAPAEDGYALEDVDLTEHPTLYAAFRYVSETSKSATVTWVGDPADTTHGVSDAPVAVYDGGRRVTGAVLSVTSNGNGKYTYTFTGLNPDKKDGYEIRCTVPEGYRSLSSSDSDFTLLNTAAADPLTASVVWWDGHSTNRPKIDQPRVQVQQGDSGVGIDVPLVDQVQATNDMILYTFYGLPSDRDYKVVFDGVPDGYQLQQGSTSNEFVLVKDAEFTFEKQWRDYSQKTDNFISKKGWVELLTLCSDKAGGDTGISLNFGDGGNVRIDGDTLNGIDGWTVTITGLPGYSGVDTEINYYVTEDDRDYTGPDNERYDLDYVNRGTYATLHNGIYNNGLSISTLRGTIQFTFQKNWVGGDENNRPEVTFHLYRFPINQGSFVNSAPVQGMDSMKLPADYESGTVITYTVGDKTSLPKYDENGALYVYYVLEDMASAGDYVTVVNNDEANFWTTMGQIRAHDDVAVESIEGFKSEYAGALKRYVLNGGSITNLKQESLQMDYSKTWVAKSIQGFQGAITVKLQRAVAGTNKWEDVLDSENQPVTQTIENFRAELMSRSSSFKDLDLPKYSDEGLEYVYRVRETGVKIKDRSGTEITASIGEDDRYFSITSSSGSVYEFTIEYNDNTNHITNKLVGTTEFQIKKTWDPALNVDDTGSIVVRLYRNGQIYVPDELPEGVQVYSDGTLKLSKTIEESNQVNKTTEAAWLLQGLPKYDETGAEYTYTAIEVNCLNDGYGLNNQWYTTDELEIKLENGVTVVHKVPTREFVNNKIGTGQLMTFDIQKYWLDDNDLLHRGDIRMKLYYITDRDDAGNITSYKEVEDFEPVTLKKDNQWIVTRYYTPSVSYSDTAPEWNAANYFMREVSIADSQATGGQGQAQATYDGAAMTGTCTTTEHVYQVTNAYTVTNPLSATVGATNLRTGTVNIEISKTWNLGDMAQEEEELTAVFTVYQNGVAYPENTTHELKITAGTDTKLEIKDLPKYDDQGVVYSYTLQETGLKDGDSKQVDFINGVLSWSNYTIVSEGIVDEYVVRDHHTNDLMRAKFTNTRTGSSEILVNKVWRDDGTDAIRELRPDIVLSLYRQSVDKDGKPLKEGEQPELVMVDRLWDTQINKWYWKCSFGNLPLFDENGYKYLYTVRETTFQASPERYKASYFVPTDENQQPTNNDPSSSKDVFEPMANATDCTIAGSNGNQGTVINTRVGTMSLNGRKHWSSLPSWFLYRDLPTVYIQLYRSTKNADDTWGNPEPYKDAEGNVVVWTLENGNTSYSFDRLPRYDEYGREMYRYSAVEVRPDGSNGYIPGAPEGYVGSYTSGSGQDDESSEIFNAYTGTPFIKISVEKIWDWSNLVREAGKNYEYPDITLTLYQCFKDDASGYSVRREVSRIEIEGDEIRANETEKTIPKQYFTNTDAESGECNGTKYFPLNVPYLGADGKAKQYTYEVVETITGNAYDVTCTNNGLRELSEDDKAAQEWSFSVKNKYVGKRDTLEATKIWDDQGNLYGTRPEFEANQDVVTFTFYRKLQGSNQAEELEGTTAWSLDQNNRWICTFTPMTGLNLYSHDTNGTPYIYYVEETLKDPYDTAYQRTDTSEDLSITNSLKTVDLKVKKQWRLENDRVVKTPEDVAAYIQPLLELLGINAQNHRLTFQLTSKEGDVATQNALNMLAPAAKTLNLSVLAADLYTENGFTAFSKLPKYVRNAEGAFVEAQYVVKETAIGSQIVEQDCDFTVIPIADLPANVFGFDNSIGVARLNLTKIWDDARNQDGMRPKTIEVTIAAKVGDKTNTSVVTLSYDASNPNSTAPWTRTIYLPVSIGSDTPKYTVTEVTVDGYSVVYKLGDGDSSSAPVTITPGSGNTFSVSMTNIHKPLRFKAEVLKVWDQRDDDYAGIDIRPVSVTVQLECEALDAQYKYDNFNEVELTSRVQWKHQWSDLYVYMPKDDTKDIYSSTVLTYKVVEKDGATDKWPYIASYSPATFNGLNGSPTVPVNVGVTNTMKTLDITVGKEWDKDDIFEDIAVRPDSLTFSLEYTTTREVEDSWEPLKKNGSVYEVTLTKDEGWKAKTFTDLPAYTKENKPLYYRVQEQTLGNYEKPTPTTNVANEFSYDSSKTNAQNKYSICFKNTARTLRISVSKDWEDFGYGNQTRPTDLTFWLQYTNVSAENRTENDWKELKLANDTLYTVTLTKDEGWTTKTFTDLPAADVDGKTLYYRVVEEQLENYKPWTIKKGNTNLFSYDAQKSNTYSVTFVNELEVTSLSVTKKWVDEDDKYGIRPKTDVSLTLQRTTDNINWEPVQYKTESTNAETGETTYEDCTLTISGDKLTCKFEKLPAKDKDGKTYTYRVVEDDVPGYELDKDETGWAKDNKMAYTLVNNLKVMDFSVTKVWKDDGNKYGTRRTELSVTLKRLVGGQEDATWTPVTKKIDADGNWSCTFEKLPVENSKREKFTYYAEENAVAGYTGTAKAVTGGYELTNTLNVVGFTGQKQWNDPDNAGKLPPKLTVTLQRSTTPGNAKSWTDVEANGAKVQVDLIASKNWSFTWTDLPEVDADGNEYTYRIHEENAPEGYVFGREILSEGKCVIINDLAKPGMFTVDKNWDDEENKYNTRPAKLSVTLQRSITPATETSWEEAVLDGQPATVELSASNYWRYSWKDLPAVNPDGKNYSYRVVENTALKGYEDSGALKENGAGYVLTNKLVTTSVTVSKTWSYGDGWKEAYGFDLPESIRFELRYKAFAAGETADTRYDRWAVVPGMGSLTLTPDAEGNWKKTIDGLPKFDANGRLYQYVALDSVTGFALTASHGSTTAGMVNTAATTRLVVTKLWNDRSNRFGLRPGSVNLTLQCSTDGVNWINVPGVTPVRSGWTYTYENLPAYTWKDGEAVAYRYRAKEAPLADYSLTGNSITGTNDAEGYRQTLTNSLDHLDDLMNITVSKRWQADDESYLAKTIGSVRVQLQRKLVEEGNDAWVDCAPEAPVNGTPQSGELTLSAASNWIGTWQDLPKQNEEGKAYVYRVKEISAPVNYPLAAPVEVSGSGRATITNALETVSLPVSKQWNDDGDALGWRPNRFSITIQSRVIGEDWADFDTLAFAPDQNGGQTMTVSGLPRYRWEGSVAVEIEYRAIDSVTGYVYVWNADSSTLVNQAKSYTLQVVKEWDDQDNAYGTRDESVTLQLRRRRQGGKWVNFGSAQTVSAESVPAWTAIFTNLPAVYLDENGQEQPYEYKLVETGSLAYDPGVRTGDGTTVRLEDYVFTCRSDGDAAHYATACTLTLVNVLRGEGFSVRKVWDDQDDLYGARPETLTVQLQSWNEETQSWQDVLLDGSIVTAVLSEDNNWTYSFRDLPTEDADGKTIVYRAVEEDVPRYSLIGAGPDADGVYTLTNHLSLLHLNVRKIWDDQQDLYHNRPDALRVTLQSSADGGLSWNNVEHDGAPVTAQLSAPDWTYSFNDLPDRDESGAALIYRAVEDVPDGYIAGAPALNGADCTLVNSLQTVEIRGEKHWNDVDNAYNTRPERIELVVYLNGERMDPQPEVVFDGWNFIIRGLPRYVDGKLAQYSVAELPVANYAAEESIVAAIPDGAGSLSLVLTNHLLCELMIDNLTPNAAHPGVTNVGGFVGVGMTAEERDEDPYVVGATTVTWLREEDWLHEPWINVSYLEFGADEWMTLHLSDCFDLTELKQRFPDARIVEEGDTRRLILADSAAGMPMRTRVEVAFRPTIAVENTTPGNRGGQVRVETGVYSPVGDGLEQRYPQTCVYGLADDAWMVDLSHLAIGVPGSQRGSYSENSAAVPLKLRSDGSFSAQVALMLAGQMETVTVTGKVKVLRRDANGNPKQISLTLDSLPANLDVGIPFATAEAPSEIPQTGDMLPVALTVGGTCLVGLILLAVLRRKRRS